MTRIEAAFGEWVVRHRWWLLAVSVLVTSVVVSGMRFLTFDNDTRAFLSDDNPQLTALQELEDTYRKTRTVLTSSASSGGLARKRDHSLSPVRADAAPVTRSRRPASPHQSSSEPESSSS